MSKLKNFPTKDAAIILLTLVNDTSDYVDDMQPDFIYRDPQILTSFEVSIKNYHDDFEPRNGYYVFKSCVDKIVEGLERESRLFDLGWYKEDIKELFRVNRLPYLPCFDDSHISSSSERESSSVITQTDGFYSDSPTKLIAKG